MFVDDNHLFQLRCAAYEWLLSNPDSLNASFVKSALEATEPPRLGGQVNSPAKG